MSGLDPRQLRDRVVRPALEHVGLWSLPAEQLVMGTAAQESRLVYLAQLGGGPALGLWQMEPATHDDIWENFLAYKPELRQLVADLVGTVPARRLALASNLAYGAAMCAVHYRRYQKAVSLQAPGDVGAMARAWKRFYNTSKGKGTEAEFIRNWSLVAGLYG